MVCDYMKLQLAGKPYPRTCPECKLGPCKHSQPVMTAPAKPTIDEQIEYQKELGYKDEYRAAILSTLRAHKAIMEAKRLGPVNKIRVANITENGNKTEIVEHVLATDYDSLLAYADRMRAERDDLQQHCDRLTGMKFSERIHAAIVSRAEAAERQLAERQAKHDKAVKDSERINWIEAHPRAAQIMVGGKVEDCIFYGVSTADLMPLRDAIDQIITQSEKPKG